MDKEAILAVTLSSPPPSGGAPLAAMALHITVLASSFRQGQCISCNKVLIRIKEVKVVG